MSFWFIISSSSAKVKGYFLGYSASSCILIIPLYHCNSKFYSHNLTNLHCTFRMEKPSGTLEVYNIDCFYDDPW